MLVSNIVGEDEPFFDSYFFRWVGSTTNQDFCCLFLNCFDQEKSENIMVEQVDRFNNMAEAGLAHYPPFLPQDAIVTKLDDMNHF